MNYLKPILILTIILFLFGCSKDDEIITPVITSENGVYIINEGNFTRSNSSLSYYSIDSNKVYNDIYYSVNGKKLGDVGQNMYIKDSKGFIVVNNSNKIVVFDTKTQKLLDTITTNLNSPRSIVFHGSNMFVSNLYGSTISVFSGENYKTFVKDITVKSNPDEMVITNAKIYCCHQSGWNSPSTILSVIDLNSEKVSTIRIGYNPIMLKKLSDGKIAILCSGEYNDYVNLNDDFFAYMYLVNPATDQVSDSIFIGSHPMDFAIDGSDFAYITGDMGIIKIDLKNKTIVNTNFISGSFYSIGYDAKNKEIYLGDPKDYKINGEVSIYKLDGTIKNKFEVGLIPGAFCFK